ncbi:MAG TPA: S24 family peptidase [Candidatus Saccharimonadales bacterium]|nr:S24 family peptidase [Candidatus Saccharimonadales bacterium]
MTDTRTRLLQLAQLQDISGMGLRELARKLDVNNPQTIKYHLQKLHDAGLLNFAERPSVQIQKSQLGTSDLIRIPIRGSVSAGPATQLASDEVTGYLRISSALLKSRNYKDLYALKVVGTSMNRANIDGKPINDGDYAIVDGSKRSPRNNDYVVAVVDDLANLKRFFLDKENEQVVLLSESSEDYSPIFVHPQDNNERLINGTVVQVLKQPAFAV